MAFRTAALSTSLAITTALLTPFLQIGMVVGTVAAVWLFFGDTLQKVFSAM